MVKPKKGARYVCGVCGTTLIVSEEGYGILEDVVCCERPMETKAARPKKKVQAKKKAKKK